MALNNLRITQRFVIVLRFSWLSLAAIIGVSLWGRLRRATASRPCTMRPCTGLLLADQAIDITVQNRLQVLLAFQHAPGKCAGQHPRTPHQHAPGGDRRESRQGSDDLFKAMERGSY